MTITPSEFLQIVKNEMLKYQEFKPREDQSNKEIIEDGPFNGLFSKRESRNPFNEHTDIGITAGIETIDLPKGEKYPYNGDIDSIRIAVEYHIPIEHKGMDQSEALKKAYPRGIIQYNCLGDSSIHPYFALATFDLQRRLVLDVQLSEKGNGYAPSLAIAKGKPLEEGVQRFFSELYKARGTPIREIAGQLKE